MKLLSKYRAEVMGVCILWIMLFHAGIKAPDQTVLRLLWYAFVSFGGGIGVNIFLICSGLGLAWSAEKKAKEFRVLPFYKRRLLRILPAFFIVAVIWYLIKFESVGKFFYNVFFLNYVLDGERDFWYILCILICYLLFPLYVFVRRRLGLWVTTPLFLLFSAGVTGLVYLVSPAFYDKWEIVLWRFLSFWIGCHIGVLLAEDKKRSYYWTVGALTVVALGLMAFRDPIHASAPLERVEMFLISPAVMQVFCWVFALLDKFASFLLKALAFLGKNSLEIYLIHVSIGAWAASLLNKLIGGNKLIYLVFYFILSIGAAFLLHWGLDQILGNKKKAQSCAKE